MFIKNGAGVLIAITSTIDMNPNLVKSNAQVEILSVTLTLKIPKSYGSQLATKSVPHSKIILRKLIGTCKCCPVTNQIIRYTVLGDFNLDYVKWDNACTSNSVHLKYAYLFEDLCLSQQKPLSFSTIIIKVSLMIWRRLLLIGKTIY